MIILSRNPCPHHDYQQFPARSGERERDEINRLRKRREYFFFVIVYINCGACARVLRWREKTKKRERTRRTPHHQHRRCCRNRRRRSRLTVAVVNCGNLERPVALAWRERGFLYLFRFSRRRRRLRSTADPPSMPLAAIIVAPSPVVHASRPFVAGAALVHRWRACARI